MSTRLRPSLREALASGRPSFSFEFFPSRTDDGNRTLWDSIRRIEPLSPTFVSVTYGAGGSSRERTVAVTEQIITETTLRPVAHLTAVAHSVAELRDVIGQYVAVGVRDVLALRGDPPGNPRASWVQHPSGLSYAWQLVELLKSLGDFTIGVAAFPEGHPRSASSREDIRHFVNKCRAGADYAITQMFFDVEDYLRFRDRVTAWGCETPIIPQIMPATDVRQIRRFAELSDAAFPETSPTAWRPPGTTGRRATVSVSITPRRWPAVSWRRARRGCTTSL